MSEMSRLQHLVIVRHGESEGDVRRAAWKRGEPYHTNKTPDEEGLTDPVGFDQSERAGDWIKRNILLGHYAIGQFDYHFVSSVRRAEQTAGALGLPGALWQRDPRLNERNRGKIRGLSSLQHKALYPESYAQMKADPVHWVPPGGKSILDVADELADFYEDIQMHGSVIVVGHRDSKWASMKLIEGYSDEELAAVNTEDFHNGQIWHYTSVDPETGWQAPQLTWQFTVDPMHPETASGWQLMPHAALRQSA